MPKEVKSIGSSSTGNGGSGTSGGGHSAGGGAGNKGSGTSSGGNSGGGGGINQSSDGKKMAQDFIEAYAKAKGIKLNYNPLLQKLCLDNGGLQSIAEGSKNLATSLGFTELSTPTNVNDHFKNKNGTTVLLVNTVAWNNAKDKTVEDAMPTSRDHCVSIFAGRSNLETCKELEKYIENFSFEFGLYEITHNQGNVTGIKEIKIFRKKQKSLSDLLK